MSKSVTLAALAAFALLGAATFATPSKADSIPPNCTLDPFTGKMNCHIWPTCTLDPFTGKMNCPVPKARMAQMARAR